MRRKDRVVFPAIVDWATATLVHLTFLLLRTVPRETGIEFAGRAARKIGPLLPRSRIGRENLRIAFPEKSERQREEILTRMWDNFARALIEYMHLDTTFDYDPENPGAGRVEVAGAHNFEQLRNAGRPAIIFTAHLANWELLGVCAARFRLDVAALFRPPTNRFLAKRLHKARSNRMGRLVASRAGVSLELAATLQAGGVIGLLVDQRFHGGVLVPFFGQPADTNPLLAKLARQYDCPVHGARAIRLPNGRLRLEISDAIELPRDAAGDIHIEKATASVQAVVEGWVREHPEQWMWVHRRWRFGRKTRIPAAATRLETRPGMERRSAAIRQTD